MKISILLPYKENFSPLYPGAVSLFINSMNKLSNYRRQITVFGSTDLNEKFSDNYVNIELKKSFLKSQTRDYVSKFVELHKNQNTDIIEIHTGEFCKNVHLGLNFESSFAKIKEASFFANHMGLEVHLGHGITFESIEKLSEINEIKEFNIGHFIVSESVFLGLKDTINEFKRLIEKGRVSR